MTNVILFPKSKINTPAQSMDELYEKTVGVRKEHVEHIIDDVMTALFERCYDEGFDLTAVEVMKPTCLLVESFRSMLYSSIGIQHPLQTTAEQIFVEKDEDDVEEVPAAE